MAVNKYEWVADLRRAFANDPRDAGVKWFGPWTGRNVACAIFAKGPQDAGKIFAGLGHQPAIIQLEVPNLFTDPDMNNLTNNIGIPLEVQTGDFDIGDAHLDKVINAFSLGIATTTPLSVTGSLAALSDIAGQGLSFQKTKTVNPNSLGFGTFALDKNSLGSFNNFSLPTWQPSSKMRGRAFNADFKIVPAGAAYPFVRISDLEFRVTTVARRSTDL